MKRRIEENFAEFVMLWPFEDCLMHSGVSFRRQKILSKI